MKRATGYTLKITDDRSYRWLHYGTKPKPAQLDTRLFPAAPGLYFGPPSTPRFREPIKHPRSPYAYGTIYLLDGRYAGSIYEYEDGSGRVSICCGQTCTSPTGESTLSVNVSVPVVDYSALEIKMVEVLRTIRAHPDYLPHMNMPRGYSITKRRGRYWMEACLP